MKKILLLVVIFFSTQAHAAPVHLLDVSATIDYGEIANKFCKTGAVNFNIETKVRINVVTENEELVFLANAGCLDGGTTGPIFINLSSVVKERCLRVNEETKKIYVSDNPIVNLHKMTVEVRGTCAISFGEISKGPFVSIEGM